MTRRGSSSSYGERTYRDIREEKHRRGIQHIEMGVGFGNGHSDKGLGH